MGEILYIGHEDDEGPVCQVCGEHRPEARDVACVECGTVHHQECWEYVGRCSTFGCGSKRYEVPAAGTDIMVLHVRDDAPLVIDEHTPTPASYRKPSSEVMNVQSRAVSLDGDRVRLDLDTPLESGLNLMALLAFLFALMFSFESGGLAVAAAAWAGLAGLLRMTTDCTYSLDNDREQLRYHRAFLGGQSEWAVAHFRDIHTVTVRGSRHSSKHGSWWEYRVAAVLRTGEVVDLTDSTRNSVSVANSNGLALARHLGKPFVRGEEGYTLSVQGRGGGIHVHQERWKSFFESLFG